MAAQTPYSAGWIDSSIHDFLADMSAPPQSMTYALITSLDSSTDLPSMLRTSELLSTFRERGKLVGQGLLLSTRQLLAAERRDRIFFGFDEVWFFPYAAVKPKPKDITLVGPARVSSEIPLRLTRWMQANSCSLGLGDGTGLNLVARLQGIAKYIVDECVGSRGR